MKKAEKLPYIYLFQRYLILGILFLFSMNLFPQGTTHKKVQSDADKIYDELVKIRRDFHRHPELSGKEERTSKIIAEYLISLGLEVKTNIGGYGVVGILHGDRPGNCIAWRADIDAFEDETPDAVPFASENIGVRHICGHDIHTIIGLGIANVLSHQKESLKGTIMFIFQPSEENFTGAYRMISDGIFNGLKPKKIFAVHLVPIPTGAISAKTREMFARRIELHVKLRNVKDVEQAKDEINNLIGNLNQSATDNVF